MACRVICVSRALGAGGEETARLVADELGFRYVDDEIVTRAAEGAGISPNTVAQAEHTPSLITRIVEALGSVSAVGDAGSVTMSPVPPSPSYTGLIEQVIRETAKEGNVIIVGHGASIPLAGEEGVLRVLVTASPEVRAKRIAAMGNADERAAKKTVADSDRERAKFLERFYSVCHELPTHYDLTVNTDSIDMGRAAHVIAQAAKA